MVVGEAILRVESFWHGRGEIGWGVDDQHTGRGLGTEIGRAMMRFGFDLGLHRLYAQCRVGNAVSLRIMTKIGMTEEGIIRDNVKARRVVVFLSMVRVTNRCQMTLTATIASHCY